MPAAAPIFNFQYAREPEIKRFKLLRLSMSPILLLLGGLGLSPTAAHATAATAPLPPIRHVWYIEMENTTYGESFGAAQKPYLTQVLPSEGALLAQYYGIGHNSLDNYIAQISGQAPVYDTQNDCPSYDDFTASGASDQNGQAVGQGCVYPSNVLTLTDQLDPKHDGSNLTWKAYMEHMGDQLPRDMDTTCAHAPTFGNAATQTNTGSNDTTQKSTSSTSSDYASKHNPFVYFHSIVDDPAYCRAHVVNQRQMFADLSSVATTPNFSWFTPGLIDDGHDCQEVCPDIWLRTYLSAILDSPAYRQDGLVIVTFDESDALGPAGVDVMAACCNEMGGPNQPSPSLYSGANGGGGRIGAVLLSRYIKPGTVIDPVGTGQATSGCTPQTCNTTGYYNHYSALRSLEDLFGIVTGGNDGHGHLGFAGTYADYAGPG
ncbi:MAG: hypothetical protein JOZ49_10810, partial [Mycolicibacterium sp.]|nr:hypothetical protein [Mycolicibacterium sp.]